MKRFLLAVVFVGLGCIYSEVNAASLFGRVIEVNSGDVITVFNLNRPVRVKLLGVDAPEMNQTFGDVARKHLSDLVLDKSVLVEYSGIGADSSLTGRVLLNNADIGAQMIRDGAAWFDLHNASRLSVSDREVYQHSEQAARSERRGLWQAENPTAPWEFVRFEALRMNPAARLNALFPQTKAKADRPVPELTNLSLMASRTPGREVANHREELVKALNGAPRSWIQFRPDGESFSILVPGEGLQVIRQDSADGEVVDVHSYMVREGWASYVLTWMKGPIQGRTEESALKEALQGVLKGLRDASGYEQSFSCGSVPQRNISMNGFKGKEFDLGSCPLPARSRAYVRLDGGHLQMYLATAIFLEEDDSVGRFLNSFTVGSAQKSKSRKH